MFNPLTECYMSNVIYIYINLHNSVNFFKKLIFFKTCILIVRYVFYDFFNGSVILILCSLLDYFIISFWNTNHPGFLDLEC